LRLLDEGWSRRKIASVDDGELPQAVVLYQHAPRTRRQFYFALKFVD